MSINPKAPIDPNSGIDNYTLPSKLMLDKVCLGPLPPQMTGEYIEETPIMPAEGNRVDDTYTEETKGSEEQRYTEPSMPYSGSVRSSVWHSRYGGAYIEVSGKKDEPEFINIVHTSGTHITLDPDGSIIIKSFGDTHNVTRGNLYENVKGKKVQVSSGGYTLAVKDGTLDIRSEGNINISSGMDLNISAAGKLNMNIGDAIDIAGARTAITSREDTMDLVSKTQMRFASNADMSLKCEGGNLSMQSDGIINTKAPEIRATAEGIWSAEADHGILGGGQLVSINASTVAIDDIVQLANGMAGSPIGASDAESAVKAGIGDPIQKSVISDNTTTRSSGSSGANAVYDDNGE